MISRRQTKEKKQTKIWLVYNAAGGKRGTTSYLELSHRILGEWASNIYHTSQLCKARNNCMTFDGTLHSQNLEPNKEEVWPPGNWDLSGDMVLAPTSQASKHFKDKTLWSLPEARREPPWPAEVVRWPLNVILPGPQAASPNQFGLPFPCCELL